jgi:hypothetical protein
VDGNAHCAAEEEAAATTTAAALQGGEWQQREAKRQGRAGETIVGLRGEFPYEPPHS